jgi:hypothetical protein
VAVGEGPALAGLDAQQREAGLLGVEVARRQRADLPGAVARRVVRRLVDVDADHRSQVRDCLLL